MGRPDTPSHCRLEKEARRPEWGWDSKGGFDFEVTENASEITFFLSWKRLNYFNWQAFVSFMSKNAEFECTLNL